MHWCEEPLLLSTSCSGEGSANGSFLNLNINCERTRYNPSAIGRLQVKQIWNLSVVTSFFFFLHPTGLHDNHFILKCILFGTKHHNLLDYYDRSTRWNKKQHRFFSGVSFKPFLTCPTFVFQVELHLKVRKGRKKMQKDTSCCRLS